MKKDLEYSKFFNYLMDAFQWEYKKKTIESYTDDEYKGYELRGWASFEIDCLSENIKSEDFECVHYDYYEIIELIYKLLDKEKNDFFVDHPLFIELLVDFQEMDQLYRQKVE